MSKFTLIHSVNELCKPMVENKEVTATPTELLSVEELDSLVSFIWQDLEDDGLQRDLDAVTDKAYSFVEDIPGLEDADKQAAAVRLILARYFPNPV